MEKKKLISTTVENVEITVAFIRELQDRIKQLELERNDCNYFRKCLFCPQEIGNNRSDLLNHMSVEHNFNVDFRDRIYQLMTKNGYERKFIEFSRWDDFYFKVLVPEEATILLYSCSYFLASVFIFNNFF
jgi:hypothetical protein